MGRFRAFLAQHRAATFVFITFAPTWVYEFVVVYPFVNGRNVLTGLPVEAMFAIGAAMFFPAIGAGVTRLITGEGLKSCWIKPKPLKHSLKWFAFAWFVPAVLITAGAIVYYFVFPSDFDPIGSRFAESLAAQVQQTGQNIPSGMDFQTIMLVQIAVGIFLGPALNIFTTFGEEWGWRGYLVPKLAEKMRVIPNMLLSGTIWGLWHAPITALGHNYGLGYPGYPFTGILAMVVFCICCGILLSFVTFRTGSCLAAAFAHGSLNALAAAPAMFSLSGGNPFIGPAPTGILGGIGFLVVAIILLAAMKREEGRS